jgi:hypothetical protein
MNEERLILQGQLAEAERELKKTEAEADGQVMILRIRTLPTLPIDRLRTREIVQAATVLHAIRTRWDEQTALVRTLREALGVA